MRLHYGNGDNKKEDSGVSNEIGNEKKHIFCLEKTIQTTRLLIRS
uniref:Uncharacterized protein n=1 Tax=Lepeophtheirus salmonis TaxID=72036 RepID=A0A0K2V2B0_LEPSM